MSGCFDTNENVSPIVQQLQKLEEKIKILELHKQQQIDENRSVSKHFDNNDYDLIELDKRINLIEKCIKPLLNNNKKISISTCANPNILEERIKVLEIEIAIIKSLISKTNHSNKANTCSVCFNKGYL